jgi:hypothetical protein
VSETVFAKVDYTLSSLMDAIELGSIGLPDIQRPFVWKNTKVRNLFDSMRGYPVGYLLFWDNGSAEAIKVIQLSRGVGPSQGLVIARDAAKKAAEIGGISAFLRARGGR